VDILARPMHWLTGPILAKELRVASRRKPVYVLRLMYLAVMAAILLPLWSGVMDRGAHEYGPYDGSAASIVYRMADLGRTIVPAMVWIQYIAVQLVAMLTMSASISDEISRRTLGTLLTTPMNAWQLVVGKLASRLVLCVSLLAMSLPILALLTVFGGVQWSFVLIGLALTLSTLLIVASVTMHFSIYNSRPYLAFLESLLTLGILFGGSVLVSQLFLYNSTNYETNEIVSYLMTAVHPVAALVTEYYSLQLGNLGQAPWWVCVIVNVAFAGLVLWRCVRVIRRASLASAMGMSMSALRQQEKSARKTPTPALAPIATPDASLSATAATHADRPGENKPTRATVRPLRGNPVYWKDSIRRRFRARSDIAAVVVFGVQFVVYLVTIPMLDSSDMSAMYLLLLGVLGSLIAVVVSATTIPAEREARTWDMVLASPLSNRRIVWGKFLAAMRRFALAYFPLGLHVLLFTIGGILHPVAAVFVAVIVAGMASFIAALGVLVGTFTSRTTAALVAVLTICLILWLVVPIVAFVVDDMYGHGSYRNPYYDDHSNNYADLIANANPFLQLGVVGDGSARFFFLHRYDLEYDWPDRYRGAGETTWVLLFTAFGYAMTAAVLLSWSSRRLRRPSGFRTEH